jgi:hypothetical protein
MSSSKPIFYFEPVSVLVGREIEETSPLQATLPPDVVVIPEKTAESAEYFLNKTVYKNSEEFKTLNIQEEIYSTVATSYNSVAQKLKAELTEVIPANVADILINLPSEPDGYYVRQTVRDAPEHLYIHKNSPALIIPVSTNTFCIISSEARHVNSLALHIKSQIESLGKVTADFGLKLRHVLLAKEYQAFVLKSMENVSKIELGEPKNDFEKEVIDTCSQVTTSFLSNVNVHFKEPTENFEYDIFVNFPARTRLVVEPTDYTIVKDEIKNGGIAAETLKSKVVLAMIDKAQRLRARGVVVTNGFPQNTFSQLKAISESRGVVLMNETDYKEKLPNELCRIMMSGLSSPRSRVIRRGLGLGRTLSN